MEFSIIENNNNAPDTGSLLALVDSAIEAQRVEQFAVDSGKQEEECDPTDAIGFRSPDVYIDLRQEFTCRTGAYYQSSSFNYNRKMKLNKYPPYGLLISLTPRDHVGLYAIASYIHIVDSEDNSLVHSFWSGYEGRFKVRDEASGRVGALIDHGWPHEFHMSELFGPGYKSAGAVTISYVVDSLPQDLPDDTIIEVDMAFYFFYEGPNPLDSILLCCRGHNRHF
jgi:hypothetical protein